MYYENQYAATAAADAATGEYAYLAPFRVGASYPLLSESDVDGRYSGGRLAHTAGTGRYTVTLADGRVDTGPGFVSPWRTAIIGSAATVVESTLDDDVAPASRIADTSWIRPGIVAWSWLDGTRATQQSLARQKSYVDAATAQGWPYVLVDDGWKEIKLALSVLYESGLQAYAGSIAAYAECPELQRFLHQVRSPTTAGSPRSSARRHRTGAPVTGLRAGPRSPHRA